MSLPIMRPNTNNLYTYEASDYPAATEFFCPKCWKAFAALFLLSKHLREAHREPW
jgi:hypothetical protein